MPTARRRPAAQEQVLAMATGYWLSQCLYVAARLGVADVLAKGPQTADAIARKVGAHAPFLQRVLRALAANGIFAADARGRFRLTPLAQTLRGNRPGSLRDFVLMIVDDYNWNAWGALAHGVTHGVRPFDHVYGLPLFDYLHQHPDKERTFAASMASISSSENEAVARAYPFGRFTSLVDVGGAHGHLLATILRRHKRLRGILYDQPQVVAGAAKSGFVTARDVRGRCEVAGGSFFDGVPTGADGYVMKYIIHDWDDETALRILRHCRAAMARGGRVLVVDHVIPPGNRPNWSKHLDINMMVLPGGKERTRAEFRALLADAGLRLTKIIPTACPLSIIESVAG